MKTIRPSFFCRQPSALALLAALGLLATASVQAGWQLAWSDEFDGTAVDPAKWTFDIDNGFWVDGDPGYWVPGWGNNELEYYTSRTNNAYVAGGLLHIVARREVPQYNGFDYTSARLKTLGLFSKTYGRFEFRARLPQGQGYWPALWMLPRDSVYGGWAASGEIDVMENKGSEPTITAGTIHYGGSSPNNVHSGTSYVFPGGGVATNFHDYRLDWETNSIKWYVDGVLYQTQTNWYSTGGPYPAPFDQPFYLIMNLAVGGNYGGNPDGTTVFPGEMQVDYVRVYDYVPSAPEAPTGLTAHGGNGQAFLEWDAPIGATGYHVKRASNSGGPYTTIASPAAAGYTDTDVSTCSSYYYVVSATNSLGESPDSSEAAVSVDPFTLAVNSGGGAAAQFGADAGFSGGTQPAPATAVIDTGGVVAPAPQAVYQTERYGNFTYTFTGLTPGLNYKVRLHFAETWWTVAGQRVFNVFTNGTKALNNFDIVVAAGARNKATVREFSVAPNGSGQIVIGYSNVVDNAKSSGIEILIPRTAAPASLTAKAGNSHVTLYWTPTAGAASYNLKRSLANGGPYTLIASGLTSTSYTDRGLTNGLTYYYVVSALKDGCESMDSAAASATPHLGWGNALSFDGVNDYVVSQQNIDIADQSFTIEMWAKRAATGVYHQLASQGTASSQNNCWQFTFTDTDRVAFTFWGPGVYTAPFTSTDWHHWAATYDVTNDVICIYRDGILAASTTNSAINYQQTGPVYIARFFDNAYPRYFKGMLDDVRIWNKARSQEEILADLSRPLTGSEPNLVAYWNFNEPSGATAYDSTSHGHHATLVSEPVWTNSTIPPFVHLNAGLPGVWASSVTWGDYDNDGWLDFLLTGWSGSSDIAQVWRNTGNGFTNVTATVAPGLPGVSGSSVAWGDYDNDERLDILLTGSTSSGLISQVWRNTGSGFTNVPIPGLTGVLGVKWSSVAWGDYDNDGRLDILLTGETGSSLIAQVWRNTGSGFTNLNVGLPGVHYGSVAWGDYDNDGWLDFLLTGWSGSSDIAQVWRNTGNGFSNVTATVAPGLPGVSGSSVAWGDYDNDGRLDILLTGSTSSGLISQVWRNTGSGFVNFNAGLPGVRYSSVAWGDYDNDGLLDILLTGQTGSGLIAQLWRNTGSGFVNLNAGLPGVRYSSAAWGDYDNDGRLDILLTGLTGSSLIAQLWRNNSPAANTPPVAPADLAANVTTGAVTLSWSAAADDQTPTNGLTYNLRVGTAPGGLDVVSPHAQSTSGLRRLPALGNAQHGLTALLTNLPAGTCYWSVQAVDTAFAGSPFAPEGSFVVVTAPQVTTLPASDVVVAGSNACVTLHGTVNPGGLPATAWFEWGATTAYGNLTPAFPLGDTNIALPVSHRLCGLAAGTTNHVRLVATNTAGITAGDDVVFIAQPENLAQNPGFEDGTDPWFGFGWTTLTAASDMFHSGAYSVFVSDRTNTWCGVAQSLWGVLQPGRSYRISAWARLGGGGIPSVGLATVKLTMKKTDGSGENYQQVASGTATDVGWTQLSGSYTLTVSGELTELLLYMEGPDAGQNFYADDFVIELIPFGAIDATVAHQTIEGFGGAIAFYNNWLTAHPYRQEIYSNIFSGLNLGLLRIGNWFRYQGTPDFDPHTRQIVSNANWMLGRPVTIEMSSWSPPAFLKSNGQTGNGGTLVTNSGGFAYAQFADYWYDSLLWYRTNGIEPAYISIQNEPDWAASWDTCIFHPTEDEVDGTNYASYALALEATCQRLTNLPAPPKLLGPEVTGIGYNKVQDYAATMNPNDFYGVAHHLYNGGEAGSADSFIPDLRGLASVFPGKPRFQTEYGDTDMLQTALLMHHSLTIEDVSAYIFWSLVWPVGGPALVQQENPWYQVPWTNAPPGTPTQSHGYWLTPQYYAMKHFSYFIEPGYRRVETPGSDPDTRVSAYLAPDNRRLVVVIIQTNSTASVVALMLNGFTFAESAVYQTVGTSAQTSQFAPLGAAPADLQWTLPGYSITTVVLDAPAFAGLAGNPDPGDGAYDVTVTPTLTWSAGSNATSHRVYFGYSSNAVATATTNSTEYQGDLALASFTPGTLASSGRYYWRVDELLGTNATAGATWTFATAVNPADAPQASGGLAGSDEFVISFASQPGQAYRVECSDSLVPPEWWPVAEALAGTGSLLQVTNTGAPLPAQRFYRVVLLSP